MQKAEKRSKSEWAGISALLPAAVVMKIFQHPGVNHNAEVREKSPIFGIDIHPSGESFATGGGGEVPCPSPSLPPSR